jgi:CBS domain-containing protein
VRSPHQSKAANFLDSRTLGLSVKASVDPAPMEPIKGNDSGGANFRARTVKDIIKPAQSISNKVSVKVALDEMQALTIDSLPVIDERGELLGTLSKNKMNRNVGGLGHDPKTEPVAPHIEKNSAYCFEDQTIEEAEEIILKAKVREVPVISGEKLLVGAINIEAIAREKDDGANARCP